MKILSAEQIRALDKYTIQEDSINSIDLMERASLAFVNWFINEYPDTEKQPIKVFCGIGNNGGDGLAVARLLYRRFYNIEIYCCQIASKKSEDFEINLKRLPDGNAIPIFNIEKGDDLPNLDENDLIIDAIFGSGLNRPIEGFWANLVTHINQHASSIIAIDIPSGTFTDQSTNSVSIKATKTLSFELPKLAFLFPENQERIGTWQMAPIGLSKSFIEKNDTTLFYVNKSLIQSLLKPRNKFDHKGNFGHCLLIVGSYGKMGAAVLAAKACLRTGVGLLKVHVPKSAINILQISVPEAMLSIDNNDKYFSSVEADKFGSIGVGCGLGTEKESVKALKKLLKDANQPLVLDADALNIISKNESLLKAIPKDSILTPHPKEFERLFGQTKNDFDRHELQKAKAKELGIYILLKGAHSCIACPDEKCYFNSTGNPGMATAGSGDVLTGIISSLLAQGNSSKEAVVVGVYLHGLAGDIAAKEKGEAAMIASDIIDHIGSAFQELS